MNSWLFQGVMTIITIYSLFGDDVRQLAFNGDQDPVFYIMTSVALVAFAVEIVISCIVRDDYWLSFYFWLDIISTVSLFADIGWIMDAIAGVGSQNSSGSNVQQATKLARAGRGARIGTKAARLARIIRLIRLIRIVKLYKSADFAFRENEDSEQAALKEKEKLALLKNDYIAKEDKEMQIAAQQQTSPIDPPDAAT